MIKSYRKPFFWGGLIESRQGGKNLQKLPPFSPRKKSPRVSPSRSRTVSLGNHRLTWSTTHFSHVFPNTLDEFPLDFLGHSNLSTEVHNLRQKKSTHLVLLNSKSVSHSGALRTTEDSQLHTAESSKQLPLRETGRSFDTRNGGTTIRLCFVPSIDHIRNRRTHHHCGECLWRAHHANFKYQPSRKRSFSLDFHVKNTLHAPMITHFCHCTPALGLLNNFNSRTKHNTQKNSDLLRRSRGRFALQPLFQRTRQIDFHCSGQYGFEEQLPELL